jgi:SAM-dependent methyltransferase
LLQGITQPIDTLVELCSGRGEAIRIPGLRFRRALALDVSLSMLEAGRRDMQAQSLCFLQADVTRMPLADACTDSVITLGGIHHVPDRQALFDEVSRILRPGGRFYWREPLDDFLPWRLARKLIYRASSVLDADTERPLRYEETEPQLRRAGLRLEAWRSSGFVAWCLLMNSDVLRFNRAAKFLPGVRALTRLGARLDEGALALPGCSGCGAQVIGQAVKA